MSDPSEYSVFFKETKEAIQTFESLNAICTHAFYIHRYHPENIKKLHKYVEFLRTTKEEVELELSNIEKSFDMIESRLIIYLHNLKRVKDELDKLAVDDKKTDDNNVVDLSNCKINDDEIFTFKRSDIESDNDDEVGESVRDYLSNSE